MNNQTKGALLARGPLGLFLSSPHPRPDPLTPEDVHELVKLAALNAETLERFETVLHGAMQLWAGDTSTPWPGPARTPDSVEQRVRDAIAHVGRAVIARVDRAVEAACREDAPASRQAQLLEVRDEDHELTKVLEELDELTINFGPRPRRTQVLLKHLRLAQTRAQSESNRARVETRRADDCAQRAQLAEAQIRELEAENATLVRERDAYCAAWKEAEDRDPEAQDELLQEGRALYETLAEAKRGGARAAIVQEMVETLARRGNALRVAEARVRELEAERADMAGVYAAACRQHAAAEARARELEALLPPGGNRGGSVGEGSWSVFAQKVTAERDEAQARADKAEADLAETRAQLATLREAAERALRIYADWRRESQAEVPYGPAEALRALGVDPGRLALSAVWSPGPTLAEVRREVLTRLSVAVGARSDALSADLVGWLADPTDEGYQRMLDRSRARARAAQVEVLREMARAAERLVLCDGCGVLDDVDGDHGDDGGHHVLRDPDPTEIANWLSARADDLEAGRGAATAPRSALDAWLERLSASKVEIDQTMAVLLMLVRLGVRPSDPDLLAQTQLALARVEHPAEPT